MPFYLVSWENKMNLKNEATVKEQPNIVLLIDAENIHSKFAKEIFDYIDKLGNVVLKRIYGDWQCDCIKSWKDPVLFYNITPCQQFSITNSQNKTKNSTDIALIIDAMTFLYEKDIDIFCIVSSDCDFYTLVRTLREKNKKVIGFGGVQVNENYKNSFDTFITLQECKGIKVNSASQKLQTKLTTSTKQATQTSKTTSSQQTKSGNKKKNVCNSSSGGGNASSTHSNKTASKMQKNSLQQEKMDSFLKENSPLQTKIKVYILSILDRNTKNGQVCDGQILFDKLLKHEEYNAAIQIDSYKLFVHYLQNLLKNSKYTLVLKQEKALISKIK